MKIIKLFPLFILVFLLQSCLAADEEAVSVPSITGETLQPVLGGAKQGNQVWVDLSESKDKSMTSNLRTDWDLGFYSGEEFRVILNGSIIMAAGKIPDAVNIDAVTASQVAMLQNEVMVGSFVASNLQYVDNPDGNYLTQTTGISPVSINENENPIYLVNMGRELFTGTIAPGSATLGGESRGWYLLQVLRNGISGYKIKYKDLNSNNPHLEYIITKNTDHAFSFFSLKAGREINVQPKRKGWDIGFTTFTNEVFYGTGESGGSYIFADFVVTNTMDGVGAYTVVVPGGVNTDQYYSNFKSSDIEVSRFIFNDQRAIGDKWRTTTGANGAQVYGDRFFIIKDAEGFFFKLRFNKMTNDKGERGYPEFEYEIL